MRCPKCNAEIEQGFLYCKVCGEEILMVPEYNPIVEDVVSDSIDNLVNDDTVSPDPSAKPDTKENTESSDHSGTASANTSSQVSVEKPSKPAPIRRIPVIFAVLISLFTLIVTGILIYHFIRTSQDNSADYQYEQAMNYTDSGEYETALKHLNRAMELSPDSIDLWLLKAQIGEAMQDYDLSITAYQYILDNLDPQNALCIKSILNHYIDAGNISQVKAMLSECEDEEIRNQYSDYIVEVPQSSFPDGEYYDTMVIELSANDLDVYYTLDGSTPTTDSFHYEDPIYLDEGHWTIRAIAVSPKGIYSDESIFNYDITYLEPDPPVITPDSGVYNGSVQIVVEVPDGCTVLYTLNGTEPTLESDVYTKPITISRACVFTAVSVSMSDTISEPVVRTYTITSEPEE